MARVHFSLLIMVVTFGVLLSHSPCFEARKLLTRGMEARDDQVPYFEESSVSDALPNFPADDEGHMVHLNKRGRVMEESVPSPGVGHH
ncbi:uncharacterized protein J3R85_009430 [Psidium guajava]|nr:uncharacterized protein J3R85_009430 [Psidium guajava]